MKRLFYPALAFAALAAFGALDASCSSCHPIGCGVGLTLTVAPASGMLAAGTYTIALSTPDGESTCAVVVDDSAQVADGTTCSVSSILPSKLVVSFYDPAPSFSVTVSLEGAELATKSFTPAYAEYDISGACGDDPCREADVQIDIP